MKKAAGTVLILALAIILANPLPGEARGGYHGGGHGGWWLPFAILGGAAVLSSIFYASQAEASRATVPEPAPAYVPPPPAAPSAAGKIFVYPRLGQSEELQAKDRYECHTWAVNQTHYDPVQPMSGVSEARLSRMRADYRRAEDACLDGRGYTVK